MVSRAHLAQTWRMMPPDDLRAVTLYEMLPTHDANHPHDPAKPYSVAVSIRRDVDKGVQNLFGEVEIDPNNRMFHLFTDTITAPWDPAFDPWELRVRPHWMVKEAGGREWEVIKATKRMNDAEIWLLCSTDDDEPIIP